MSQLSQQLPAFIDSRAKLAEQDAALRSTTSGMEAARRRIEDSQLGLAQPQPQQNKN